MKLPKLFTGSQNPLLSLTLLLLSACGAQSNVLPENPFVAPTIAPVTETVVVKSPTAASPATDTVSCVNDLVYVEDITVADGTRFAPRDEIEKIWLVRNEGTCNWEAGYTLRLISGPDLGAGTELALFPARSGSEVEIRIIFEAPGAPGNFVSKWQAFSPAGEPFGEIIFIDINVDLKLAPTLEGSAEGDGG